MPAAALLGASAVRLPTPGDARRCGDETVSLYRRAAPGGFEVGTMRAGGRPMARFAGRVVDESSDAACPRTSASARDPPAGDRADAAAAKALFRGLLVTDADARAAARLKELQRAEEMWLVKRGAGERGEHDIAYVLADALVDGAARVAAAFAVCVVAFSARNTRVGARARAFVWRWSGCAAPRGAVAAADGGLGVTPHRRVGGGRAAARAVQRTSAKRWRSRSSRRSWIGRRTGSVFGAKRGEASARRARFRTKGRREYFRKELRYSR